MWWVDGRKGVLRLWDQYEGPERIKENPNVWYPRRPRAYVIGLTNALLLHEGQGLNADVVLALIDSHSDYYLFKRWRSLVLRIRPGESSDTAWAALPEGTEPEAAVRDLSTVVYLASKVAEERDGKADLSENERELIAAVNALGRELDAIDAKEAAQGR